jgi:hypothetical protein
MFTKTKIALAATLVAVTSTVALAQDFDPNLANRYPAYADPIGERIADGMLQSAPVQLSQPQAWTNYGQFAPQYNRNVPGNQGDTSYGQDWAQARGGGY